MNKKVQAIHIPIQTPKITSYSVKSQKKNLGPAQVLDVLDSAARLHGLPHQA